LGYFRLSHLEKIACEKAYFLSRYKTGTLLYIKDKQGWWQELDLFTLLSSAKDSWDLADVWIGKKERLPVRLVIERLPEEVKARRLKKLTAQLAGVSKQQSHWESSKLKQLLCGFNLFITNAEASKLSREQVSSFYTLRWQTDCRPIELFFKIWKSVLSIDKIAQTSIFRFECLLYGRLIALLVSTQIQAFLRDKFAHDPDIDIELSEWKAIAHLKKNY
jgi:Transposase DDE domain